MTTPATTRQPEPSTVDSAPADSVATAPVPALPVLTRVSFRFSAHGRAAACLARTPGAPLAVEAWSLDGDVPRWRSLPTADLSAARCQPLPLDDGRVLLLRNGAGSHRLSLVGGDGHEELLGEEHCLGLRLTGHPGDDALALAIATHAEGHTTISRVHSDAPALRPVVTLDGVTASACWLDDTGDRLAVNQLTGSQIRVVVVDLSQGTVAPLDDALDPSLRLLLAAPASGLLLFAQRHDGVDRLCWSTVDQPARLQVPSALREYPLARALPLTTDASGRRIALRVEDGARHRLAVFTPAEDGLAEVSLPAGCLGATASWTGAGLQVLYTAPTQPLALATVYPDAPASFRVDGSTPRRTDPTVSHRREWIDASVETFTGPAGPIEALVYCDGDWRRAGQVLLALHGGPVSAWRLGFNPLLQQLAQAGLAVIAPNQRGSTGYGTAHQDALRGAWGGPDLDDVRHLGRTLVAERGGDRLGLFGTSYGAFLALLAAGVDPDTWSRCAVTAPFLSAARLYADAGVRVRALVDRLDGRTELCDALGPRDVLRFAARLRTPLLLIHGEQDPIVPVSQSRVLRNHLRGLGRREHLDFTYLEIAGGGHDPVREAGFHHRLTQRLTSFLAGDEN